MDKNKEITVEVVFAMPREAHVILCTVPMDSTIQDVIAASGIFTRVPTLKMQQFSVGIFNKVKQLTDKVQAGDRIEIYRPLKVDPKELRRSKAKKNQR